MSNKTTRFHYKKSSIMVIIILLLFTSIFFLWKGLLGFVGLFIMLIYITITNNVYLILLSDKNMIIKKFYGKNLCFRILEIKEISLGDAFEDMHFLGMSRHLKVTDSEGYQSVVNVERVANSRFEFELQKFCKVNGIRFLEEVIGEQSKEMD